MLILLPVFLIHLAGAYPIWLAFRANRRSTFFHTLWWMIAAWLSWGVLLFPIAVFNNFSYLELNRLVALSLTGCCGIAVMGARRPIVNAWNFVVLGLLAVMLLPAMEQSILGKPALDWIRLIFLAITLAILIVNYLFTSFRWAAIILAIGCGWELFALIHVQSSAYFSLPGWFCLALIPWAGMAGWKLSKTSTAVEQEWKLFRDRFGLFWGQRMREQFNQAARNNGWNAHLGWNGLLPTTKKGMLDREEDMLTTIKVLQKRFTR